MNDIVQQPTTKRTTTMTILRSLLLEYRNQVMLKQSEIATVIGLTPSAYSKLEAGSTTMSVTHLIGIATALKMNASVLLEQTEKIAIQMTLIGGWQVLTPDSLDGRDDLAELMINNTVHGMVVEPRWYPCPIPRFIVLNITREGCIPLV